MTKITARQSSGYDTIKANTNLGYGYAYAWADMLESELDLVGLENIEDFKSFLKKKIVWLYEWIDQQDAHVQDGAEDAITTLEQSDWDYAKEIMEAELSIMADLGIEIPNEYV